MPEAIPAVAEYLAADTAAAAITTDALSAAALDASVAGSGVLTGGAIATGGSIAGEVVGGSIIGGSAGAAGMAAGSVFGDAATKFAPQLLNGVGSAVASSLLSPKAGMPPAPTVAPVTAMPDPLAQQDALRKSIIAQTARRGRSSTVLTDSGSGSGKLGG